METAMLKHNSWELVTFLKNLTLHPWNTLFTPKMQQDQLRNTQGSYPRESQSGRRDVSESKHEDQWKNRETGERWEGHGWVCYKQLCLTLLKSPDITKASTTLCTQEPHRGLRAYGGRWQGGSFPSPDHLPQDRNACYSHISGAPIVGSYRYHQAKHHT